MPEVFRDNDLLPGLRYASPGVSFHPSWGFRTSVIAEVCLSSPGPQCIAWSVFRWDQLLKRSIRHSRCRLFRDRSHVWTWISGVGDDLHMLWVFRRHLKQWYWVQSRFGCGHDLRQCSYSRSRVSDIVWRYARDIAWVQWLHMVSVSCSDTLWPR